MATKLKRTITWRMLALYGLGNILGAGIYVLIGEIAAESGDALAWSFLVAAIVSSFTAITYSAMASRYPVSAGAAVYSERAFGKRTLSTAVGLALALTAVVSSSALLRGLARFINELLQTLNITSSALPAQAITLPVLAILSYFAFRGIKDSARLAILFTLLEAGGLVLIILVAGWNGDIAGSISTTVSGLGGVEPLAIGLGGFLAFYAYVGFEDMVNVAEEVKQPETSMRRGMLTAVAVATVLYMLVALSALAVLSSSELAESSAPLAAVFEAATNSSIPIITIIGIIAITNGVLIQIVTSSRIVYGLAREGWITKSFAQVASKSKVPVRATTLAVGSIAIASSLLPLGALAQFTSFMLLLIFTLVHMAAIRLIKRGELPKLKLYVPAIGIIVNLLVIALQIADWFGAI